MKGVLREQHLRLDDEGLSTLFCEVENIVNGQEVCRQGLEWDEPIEGVSLQRWEVWLQELVRLKEWNVPRCYKSDLSSVVISRQLHVFADASEEGYGMCAYLRQEDSDGRVQVSLVLARGRVAPLKYVSIPRLELTAAVMGARLANTVLTELGVKEVHYWTDSQTVLRYLQNDSMRFKTFVANRVAVIRDLTEPNQWRYVRTCNNPADEASRGQRIDEFLGNERWVNGPDFLRQSSKQWPDLQGIVPDVAEGDLEVKVSNVVTVEGRCCFLDGLLTRYSSYPRLKRVVAMVLMVAEKFKRGADSRPSCNRPTLDHSKAAERLILAHEQRRFFAAELKALKGGNVDEVRRALRRSPLRNLDPILIGDLISVSGRLRRATLPEEMKHQVIIPKDSGIAQLVVMEAHAQVGHMGRAAMLANLWQRYWLIGASAVIKSVVGRCVTCKKNRAGPSTQQMASLPAERVMSDKPPFENTGLDMFGPFEVKQGRSMVKRYGLLFTCLATRAIHLEIVHTANADSCLNAIRRFISRRGEISSLRTDNGTNFEAGSLLEERRGLPNPVGQTQSLR
ncbi:PREDICTED: uncharacterized protein LOC106818575 [Priapulus caudatus]|uniref:Uncharacterized protein LOC106818575 n=1 Tax=Priapulus caudatus TaxID=37621 RepID=A0ABM1F2T6_PRICU|nr:PREDICTED: uncharacterized protein LOC106818575 [Priapulus caudatus]